MAVTAIQHSAETLRRRKVLSRTWAVVVVVWSLIRTAIVWALLGEYGINPWIYLGIDLVSAAIDAYSTPRMVLAFIDDHHRQAAKWLGVSAVAFVIPDLYIFLGTRVLPRKIIVVVCAIILTTTTVAVIGIVRKIREGRRLRRQAAAEALFGT